MEEARIDLDRWEDEYKRMKFLVERKSLPPNDFQKIEAAYNAAGSDIRWRRKGRERKIAPPPPLRHTPRRRRPARNESGWVIRGCWPRSPATYVCEESIPARRSPRARRSSPSSTSIPPRCA